MGHQYSRTRTEAGRARARSPATPEWAQATSLELFTLAYEDWKAATVRFEEAVARLHSGDAGAREQAQECARELARLHHELLEASQPIFAEDGDARRRSDAAPGLDGA